MHENPLDLLLNPASVAIVGAGNNPMKMGTLHALSIVKDGYQGRVYAVHRNEPSVLGLPTFPSVEALPEPPDLALLVVPAPQVPGLLESFGQLGTRRAIVITAGFREAGPEGIERERQALEAAGRYGLRLLGPNCMGVISGRARLNTTVMPFEGPPGPLGLASQSGTYVTQSLAWLRRHGIRLGTAVSLGNSADIDIVDALEHLGRDPEIRAIALYIEGLRDGRRFLETARAITPYKPVVAQYVGGSAAGARSGMSHTGALAGPESLYDGIFRQAGVIRAASVEELYGLAWTLACQPPLRGPRVAVVTNSGGPGTAIANTCEQGGMEVPRFSERLQAELAPDLPVWSPRANPVDLTFHLDIAAITLRIPERVMRSGEIDGVVLHGAMQEGYLREIYRHLDDLLPGLPIDDFLASGTQVVTGAAELPARLGLPLVVSSFFDRLDNYTRLYHERGVPVFDSPEKAARAMVALDRHRRIRERGAWTAPKLPGVPSEARRIVAAARQAGRTTLDEQETKALLASHGVPVCPERLVHNRHELPAALAEIGRPWVLKACSPELPHKSERGLVRTGIGSEEEAGAAFEAIRAAAGFIVPVLVQPQIDGFRELMAGMTRIPAFGPCVVAGSGGVLAEAHADTAWRCAPLSDADGREMLGELRAARMLGPFRGQPAADLPALSAVLAAVGRVGLLHPEIRELDLNPIILHAGRPVVVDALAVLEPVSA